MHALLAKLRTRARKDLDELAKKQNATEAFKAKVKRDEVTRKAHPSQEKENPKVILQMDADIGYDITAYSICSG